MTKTFELLTSDHGARRGRLSLKHGIVETPAFMPVGTRACVKTLCSQDMKDLGAPIVLANTYHLALDGTPHIIAEGGGLHSWMSWDRPILTDSGGFQIFSLSKLRSITEEGAKFRNYRNGTPMMFTPESVVSLQESWGSDIHMIFDECLAYGASYKDTEHSMQRSLRWAQRSQDARKDHSLCQFGIVQGGMYPDLRRISAESISQMNFDGIAIGGLSVGESHSMMRFVTESTCRILPEQKPRYLMGVGTPQDLIESIALGVDMFDCVMPTRNARNGCAFTSVGKIHIRNVEHRYSEEALDPNCSCSTCLNYSRSYLRYLFTVGEHSAKRLLSIHNLHFYLTLMRDVQKSIEDHRFQDFLETFQTVYPSFSD